MGDGTPQGGTITGARDGRLRIRLDGWKHSASFHPTWRLQHLGKAGNR
jgi:hypothetical protein